MRAALNRIPAPLLVAELGAIAVGLFGIARMVTNMFVAPVFPISGMQLPLVGGSAIAISVLMLVGTAQLAPRLSGTARVGANVAAVSAGLLLAYQLIWLAVTMCEIVTSDRLWPSHEVSSLIHLTLFVAFTAGLGIATRRWYWIALGVVTAFAAHRPWFLDKSLFHWGADHIHALGLIVVALKLIANAAVLAITLAATREATPAPDPAAPTSRLHAISWALRGLAAATALLLTFTWLREMNGAPMGMLFTSELAIIVATFLQVAALAVLALAALANVRGRNDLPAWLMVVSAGLALCVTSLLLSQGCHLIDRFFAGYFADPDRTTVSSFFGGTDEPAFVPSVANQLVSALAIGGILVSLAISARHRALESERADLRMKTAIFAAFAFAALTVTALVADAVELNAYTIPLILVGQALLLASWLFAAHVVRCAAPNLASEAMLPAAKLVVR